MADNDALESEDPWTRLNKTRTISSLRRTVCYKDDSSHKDALDISLASVYDQANDLFRSKKLIFVQPDTCTDSPRTKKLRLSSLRATLAERERHPLRIISDPSRVHPSYVRLAHDNPHSLHSRHGYSRKPNGGVFTH